MDVCVCVRLLVRICVCICVCMWYGCVCICVSIRVFMCVSMIVSVCVYVCVYVYMCVYVYIVIGILRAAGGHAYYITKNMNVCVYLRLCLHFWIYICWHTEFFQKVAIRRKSNRYYLTISLHTNYIKLYIILWSYLSSSRSVHLIQKSSTYKTRKLWKFDYPFRCGQLGVDLHPKQGWLTVS